MEICWVCRRKPLGGRNWVSGGPNQSSGHSQIRIDLHTQPGTLRRGNVALLVDCRRVAENRKALAVVANRRVVGELQQVCGNGAYGFLYRTVRCDLPVEGLGQHANLSDIANPARE